MKDKERRPATDDFALFLAMRISISPDISSDRGIMARWFATRFAHPAPRQ